MTWAPWYRLPVRGLHGFAAGSVHGQTIGFGGNGLVGGVPGGPGDGCGGRGTGGTGSGPVGDPGGCGLDVVMGCYGSKLWTAIDRCGMAAR